jgi:crossover junction endodeoxyribonuclease RuvC
VNPELTICGIDPGIGGALALVYRGGIELIDMPTIEVRGKRHVCPAGVTEWLEVNKPDMVVIEHVQGVQGAGATSAFSFGRSFGLLEGVVAGLGLRHCLVRPQAWTKALRVSRDKGSHRAAAKRLWPANAHLFARVKDDGRADAALMAHWMFMSGVPSAKEELTPSGENP